MSLTNQQILDQAPEEWTHYSDLSGYWRLLRDEEHQVNFSMYWFKGVWIEQEIESFTRSRYDIEQLARLERENEVLKQQFELIEDENMDKNGLLLMQSHSIALAHRIASTAPTDKAICEALNGVIEGAKERLEQFAIEQKIEGIKLILNSETLNLSMGERAAIMCIQKRLRTNAGGK